MKQSLKWAAVGLTLSLISFGCADSGRNRTSETNWTAERTTTTTSPPAQARTKIDMGTDRAIATGQDANGDRADVVVTPNGGVDVNVQGEPIRDRIRERRAARDANVPH